MRTIKSSTPSPRFSASKAGRFPNQRESGGRSSTLTALPVRRSRQPLTSYTVKVSASRGLTATHVWTPK
jgi:hypothetical protein